MQAKLGFVVVAAALAASSSAPAWGAVMVEAGPGNVQGDENVLFNEDGLTSQGTVVEGITNQSGLVVEFTGSEPLKTFGGGQARVEAQDGALTTLTVALAEPGGSFTSLILNLDAAADGEVTFVVSPVSGPAVTFAGLDLGSSGQNFFLSSSGGADRIASVSFTSTVAISDVDQVRVGGAVPEPGGLALLGCGGLALLARRRRRRSAPLA